MLLGLKKVSYRIGSHVLLDQVDFSLLARERVALVGRNGAGKTTLFRILAGIIKPEDGEVVIADGVVVRSLDQQVPQAQQGSVFDMVSAGLGEQGLLLAQYHDCLLHHTDDLEKLGDLQSALDACNGWNLESRVHSVLTRLKLDPDAAFADLSGGLKRRVMLAQALVVEPDVLLLDEPTNHLDIPSIEQLETLLAGFNGAVLFVSHDRAFMRRLATRVCDLDRGYLSSWSDGYDGYLKGKAEALHAEEKQTALFDKKLAQEEVWIRRGVEARRTRNEGRVRALKDMREQFQSRRRQLGTANIVVQEAERSGKLVAEAKHISLAFGERCIVRGFDTIVLRGDKIGIIGPNGCGKTTLLQMLLGQLVPDSGSVRHGARLEIAYFDQLRSPMSGDRTALDLIGDGKEYITINNQPRHVIGYLQDFLFTPDRARQPVRTLSGGERARLLLAQMFSVPSNVLVLDEPTNDLDIETLDLLEERLADYGGTVLLVSHDRDFIDRVVTRSFVFEGDGMVGDFVGGYEDWLRQRTSDPWADGKAARSDKKPASASAAAAVEPGVESPKKRSFKEQRELEVLPRTIETLESEQTRLVGEMNADGFFRRPRADIDVLQARLAEIERLLQAAYARWTELDG
ncbi:MAG: ATP-binding cassette domain-containing protein [Burkholderiaceae bacterium]|jgi:ATP-binding cassette subfamily F protein uup